MANILVKCCSSLMLQAFIYLFITTVFIFEPEMSLILLLIMYIFFFSIAPWGSFIVDL